MRSLYIFFMICCATAGRSFALDTVSARAPFAIYIEASGFLPIGYGPGPGAGCELMLYKRMSVTIEAAGLYNKGYAFRANVKCYLNSYVIDKKEISPYLAIEYANKRQQYSVTDDKYNPDRKTASDIAVSYNVAKEVDIVNVKIGYCSRRTRSKLFHSFYTDIYGGIGLRYRLVCNNLLPGQTDNLYHWHEGQIDNISNSDYKGFAPSLSLWVSRLATVIIKQTI